MAKYVYESLLPDVGYWVFAEEMHQFGRVEDRGHDSKKDAAIEYAPQNSSPMKVSLETLGGVIGFEPLSSLRFRSVRDMQRLLWEIPEEVGRVEVTSELADKIRAGSIHSGLRVFQIGVVQDVDVGHGLGATCPIAEGALIGEYVGLVSDDSLPAEALSYCCQYPSCDGGTHIDAKHCGNIIRFINHSSQPNVCFRGVLLDGLGHIICVALRNIEPGEEITVDYGPSYWSRSVVPLVELVS